MCRAYIGPQILVMACDARKNSGAARKLGSTDRYGVKTEKKQTVQLCRLFDKGFEDRVGHVLQHPTAPELHMSGGAYFVYRTRSDQNPSYENSAKCSVGPNIWLR